MATTYTTNVRLQKPSTADRGWDVPLNANADFLDALASVGGLTVTTLESPSTSLNCRVSAGTYLASNGAIVAFPGAASLAIPTNATSAVWLTDAGVPVVGAAFPTMQHARLAQVMAGPSTIVQIVDARMAYQSSGANAAFVSKSGDTIGGPLQVVAPSSGTPVLALDPTNQMVGFFGVATATQAPRLNPLTDGTGGTAGDALANVGASFAQATLNNNFASLAAKVDTLIAALKRHGLMSS